MREPLITDRECINCGDDAGLQPARLRVVRVSARGDVTTLEEWPVCAACEQTTEKGLSDYVKYALS